MSELIVTVYTAGPGCQACRLTTHHLSRRGIPFTEVPIDSDEQIMAAINELGFTTAPVVCASTSNGELKPWCGYRPDRIDELVVR